MQRNELEKFHHTVGILVKAYLNDTLEHGNCSACAVGNLVANAMSVKPVTKDRIKNGELWRFSDGSNPLWQHVFCSNTPGNQKIDEPKYFGETKEQIDSTGYSWQELARIEKAFEKYGTIFLDDTDSEKSERMFKGLMAVVDILADIHKVDLLIKEEAKAMFVKP